MKIALKKELRKLLGNALITGLRFKTGLFTESPIDFKNKKLNVDPNILNFTLFQFIRLPLATLLHKD